MMFHGYRRDQLANVVALALLFGIALILSPDLAYTQTPYQIQVPLG